MMMMVMMMVMVMVTCVLPVISIAGGDILRSESLLRQQVFQDYDKTVPPSLNVSIQVKSLQVQRIQVREDAHSLLLHGSLHLAWRDPRLKWSLQEHEGLDRLGVEPQDLWRPDLAMIATSASPPRSHMPVLVYPDGEVIFIPPVDLTLSCLLDLTYWPYDVLTCALRSTSWVHQGHMLNVTLEEHALEFIFPANSEDIEVDNLKSEWEVIFSNLTRHTEKVRCCFEPQITLVVAVVVRRSAPAMTWLMKTPVLCLCVMTCLVFLLPPSGSEKVVFGGVCVLLNILFLGLAAIIVYKDPMHTPLIVQLVTNQVVLTVVSVVVAVVVMRLARGPHFFPLPHVVNKLTSCLATLLCLSSCSKRAANDQDYTVIVKPEQIELGDQNTNETRRRDWPQSLGQWVLLAAVVDRLSLVLYLAACAVTFIRFSPVL